MAITIPIWLLITILYVALSAALIYSGSRESGYFGGFVQMFLWLVVTAAYLAFLLTYVVMRFA